MLFYSIAKSKRSVLSGEIAGLTLNVLSGSLARVQWSKPERSWYASAPARFPYPHMLRAAQGAKSGVKSDRKWGKEGVIDRIKYRLVIDIWDAVCCLSKTLNQYPLYPMQEEFQACKAKTISKFICRENRTTSASYGQLTKQAFTRYDMWTLAAHWVLARTHSRKMPRLGCTEAHKFHIGTITNLLL